MKDNGVEGGTHTLKVIDAETGAMWTVAKGVFGSAVFDLQAWALRDVMERPHGKATLDIKFYLLGGRRVGIGAPIRMQKGDYFLLDFLRLEAAHEDSADVEDQPQSR